MDFEAKIIELPKILDDRGNIILLKVVTRNISLINQHIKITEL